MGNRIYSHFQMQKRSFRDGDSSKVKETVNGENRIPVPSLQSPREADNPKHSILPSLQ